MSLINELINALRTQTNGLSEEKIRQFAEEIAVRIQNQSELNGLPNAVVTEELVRYFPTIQIMVAENNSTISDAAQRAYQILLTQVVDDPRSTIPVPYRSEEGCPYPGLSAFSEADQAFFYGREREVETLFGKMDRPMVALTGSSGVGKTSVVFAGVLPKLKAEYGESAAYLSIRLHSGTQLLADFAEQLGAEIGESADTILQMLRARPDGLHTLWQAHGVHKHRRLFLILDQFETIFVSDEATQAADRGCFLDNLLYLEKQPLSAVTTLITTRENFFEHPDYQSRGRLQEIIQNENVRLAGLHDRQLRDAIEKPLQMFNQRHALSLEFQAGVIDLIIHDFHNLVGSLPLVQYLLRLLWREKHRLTHFAYNSLGGVERVLDRHAWQIYRNFSDEEAKLVKGVLIALVRPGLSGEYTRKRVRRDALLDGKTVDQQQKIEKILSRLTDSRSRIVSEQQIGSIAYVELTHEIILRQWLFLQGLIEERKDRIEERERLLPTAELWIASQKALGEGGDPSYLYQKGSSLQRAQRYVEASHLDDIDSTIAACYQASRQYHRRWLRRLRWVGTISFILASLLIVAAWAQTQRAEEAEIQVTIEALERATAQAEVTVQSVLRSSAESDRDAQEREALSLELAKQSTEALAQNNIQDALGFALQAVDVTYSVDGSYTGAAEAALYHALMESSHPVARISSRTDLYPVVGVAQFLPDGERFLTSQGYLAGLWDLKGEMVTALNGVYGSDMRFAAVAADGSVFVTAEIIDDTVMVWDGNGRLQHIICSNPGNACGSGSPEDNVDNLAISPDGTAVVTIHNGVPRNGEQESVARVWHIDGALLAELRGHSGEIVSVSFSPDGTQLLTSGRDNTARLWEIDGRFLHLFDHMSTVDPSTINGAQFSQDGRYILTINGVHNTVALWHRDGSLYREISHNAPVVKAVFSPDNYHLLTMTEANTLENENPQPGNEILTVDENNIVQSWESNNRPLVSVMGTKVLYSPTQDLFTTQKEGDILLWRGDGQLVAIMSGEETAQTVTEFSPDGSRLITINGGQIRLWRADGSLIAELAEIPADYYEVVGAMWAQFDPTGEHILTYSIGSGSRVSLWDKEGNFIYSFAQIVDGHQELVWQAAFSPDGETVATTGCARYVDNSCTQSVARLWDTSGNLLAELEGHQQFIYHVIFSPDGKRILTRGDEGEVRLWASDGTLINSLLGHTSTISSWAFSPNSDRIATYDSEGGAFLWSYDGEQIAAIGGTAFQFNEAGTRLLGMSREQMALWDENGTLLGTYPGQAYQSTAAAKGERFLTVVDGSDEATLWDMDGHELATLGGHDGPIRFTAIQPDGSLVITGDAYQGYVWDGNGNLLATLNGGVNSVEFSKDGQRLLTTTGADARLWDATGTLLAVFVPDDASSVALAQLNPDETRVLATVNEVETGIWAIVGELQPASPAPSQPTSEEEDQLWLWDIDGNLITPLAIGQMPNRALFSPDGAMVLTLQPETAYLWDLQGNLLQRLTLPQMPGRVTYFAEASFSPDGNWLLTTSKDAVFLWRVHAPLLASLRAHTLTIASAIVAGNSASASYVTEAIFSPNGQTILTGNRDWTGQMWDVNGQEMALFSGHREPITAITFHPDGDLFALADEDGMITLWRSDGTLVAELNGASPVTQLSFNFDGSRLLAIHNDATAQLWDSDGDFVAELTGHVQASNGYGGLLAGFSSDGNYVITAGCEQFDSFASDCTAGAARIWDKDGQLLHLLPQQTDRLSFLAINPTSDTFITGTRRSFQLWNYAGEVVANLGDVSGWTHMLNYSADGAYIIAAGYYAPDFLEIGFATVWNGGGENLLELDLQWDQTAMLSAHFIPDTDTFITSHVDGTARIWQRDGTLLTSMDGGSGEIVDTVISPSGNRILTLGSDGTARLWGGSGQLLFTFPNAVSSAMFSADESRLLTVADGDALLWQIYPDIETQVADAQNRLGAFIPEYSHCFTDGTHDRIPDCFQAEYEACLDYLGVEGCGEPIDP